MKAMQNAANPRPRRDGGFTLIELLVTIAIIAILAAIAVPAYISYKQRAVDDHMIRDLKNAAIAMESYYADHQIYTDSVTDLITTGLRQTPGVSMTITLTSTITYTMTAAKSNGTKPSYTLNSTTGLIQ